MKKILPALFLPLLLCLAPPVQAGTFGTADILKPGRWALGLEPSLRFAPADLMLFVHGGYGLSRTIDLNLRLGLGADIYFGGEVEFQLIRDSRRGPGLSFTAGAHGSRNFGLDANLLLSNRFRTFTLYAALDANLEFVERGSGETELLVPLRADIGVAIPVSRNLEFLLEGNMALSSSARNGLSGGLMFYL